MQDGPAKCFLQVAGSKFQSCTRLADIDSHVMNQIFLGTDSFLVCTI